MPSINKTSLGLNQWDGADKPLRADFNADNTLLNQLLQAHFTDTALHFTDAAHTQLEQGIVTGIYLGDGKEAKAITLPFSPRFLVVFHCFLSPVGEAASGALLTNLALATQDGASFGLDLVGKTFTAYQGSSPFSGDHTQENMNRNSETYCYAAFR